MAVINFKKNKNFLIITVSLLLFIIDRLTKYLAFKLPEAGIFYWPQVGFKFSLNQGIAFSLPVTQIITIVFSALIIIILIYFWLKFKTTIRLLWPLSLIIIGAVSNLIDRLKFGGVVDFIDWWYWPTFNLADVFIVIGIIWLIWSNCRSCQKA